MLAGRYIVTLADGADATPAEAAARAAAGGADVSHVYASALRGYAATLPSALLTVLLSDPDVASVEPDRVVSVAASQPRAPYGLDRIDQRSLPLNGRYDYTRTGAGVTACIVDTGIRLSHKDSGGRAVSGFDAVDGGRADDCNGHGTHVAGTVGGTAYGVAKQVQLVAVRVLDCKGSGTSMASPHVAGAAALHLQSHPSASPAAVVSALRAATTKNVVMTPRARAGLLAGLLGGAGGGQTPNNDLLHVR